MAAGATIMGIAAVAMAIHGPGPIDLTNGGATVQHQGAVFLQGPLPAGTGQFSPFLTLNTSGNTSTEQGHNTDAKGNGNLTTYDSFFGGGRTHEVLVSAIPVIDGTSVGAPPGEYREFVLDANDQGSDKCMSVDDIRLFVDEQPDLKGFDPSAETFFNDDGDAAQEIFDLDTNILMSSQRTGSPDCGGDGQGESGSGVGDITVLIPNSVFPDGCGYGDPTCDQYLYFWTEKGGYDPAEGEDGFGFDWDVSAGFEEWRIRLLPVVNVSKTADEALTRSYDWDIDKQVAAGADATDGFGESVTLDLFDGQSGDVTWKLTATRMPPVDSDPNVSGTITILNPTGPGQIIEDPIDAEIASVVDVLELASGDIDAGVQCGVAFPYVLEPGATLECTYDEGLSAASDGDNVATAVISTELGDRPYSGTAEVDFSTATITEIDGAATWVDLPDLSEVAVSPGEMFTYNETFTCDEDEGGRTNTATLTEGDTSTVRTDDASVDVNCYVLTVTKNATPTYTRTYDWDIDKQVADGADATGGFGESVTLDLFDGQSGDVTWKLTATRNAPVDSDFAVSGTITIDNTGNPVAANGVSVSDSLTGGIGAVVDCDPGPDTSATVDVAANSTATCTYSADLPDASSRTNTATATLAGVDYTGTAAVTFGAPTTVTDESATWVDLPELTEVAVSPGEMFTYNETFTCDEDEGGRTNTATLTEGDTSTVRTDDASVDVNCYVLTVTKNATPTYTRTYDWDIDKQVADGADATGGFGESVTLDLFDGQSGDVTWKLTATRNAPVDSDFAVSGTITIDNTGNPVAANGVSVSDSLTGGIGAVVDCDPGPDTSATVDVAANSTATCTYSADLPDASSRTNTATATLAGVDYTGTAAVTFGAPTTVTDESATWVDLPDLSEVAVSPGEMFTYNETFTCDEDEGGRTNTATLTEGDTSTVRTDDASVDVNCYVLTVTKNATPTYTRTYDWDIDKRADKTQIELNVGGSATINYVVEVDATATNSAHAVSGTITIDNTGNPVAANGVSVSDSLTGGIGAVVDCDPGPDTSATVDVAANSTATCTYSADLPDASSRTNTATATFAGVDYTGTAAVTFGAPTTVVDEIIDVVDTIAGNLGQVDATSDTLPKEFAYSKTVTSVELECGENIIDNTAMFTTNDTSTTGSDDWRVIITLICGEAQLTPTGTECFDFAGGTASDQDELLYRLSGNPKTIQAVTPGAFIYWTEVLAPSSTFTIEVGQSAAFDLFEVAQDGPKLFDGSCDRVQTVTVDSDADGQAQVTVTGATPGATYYLTVKYDSSSLAGAADPGGAVLYTWGTYVDGTFFAEDTLTLRPR